MRPSTADGTGAFEPDTASNRAVRRGGKQFRRMPGPAAAVPGPGCRGTADEHPCCRAGAPHTPSRLNGGIR